MQVVSLDGLQVEWEPSQGHILVLMSVQDQGHAGQVTTLDLVHHLWTICRFLSWTRSKERVFHSTMNLYIGALRPFLEVIHNTGVYPAFGGFREVDRVDGMGVGVVGFPLQLKTRIWMMTNFSPIYCRADGECLPHKGHHHLQQGSTLIEYFVGEKRHWNEKFYKNYVLEIILRTNWANLPVCFWQVQTCNMSAFFFKCNVMHFVIKILHCERFVKRPNRTWNVWTVVKYEDIDVDTNLKRNMEILLKVGNLFFKMKEKEKGTTRLNLKSN